MPTSPTGKNSPRRAGREAGFTPVRRSAEHGFMSLRRSAEYGFTLVELMIVITIIGIASAAVLWSLPDPRGRLIDEATRFAARTRAAHDLAVVNARPVSLWVSAGGYGFDERRAGAWVPIIEKPLRVTAWGKGTHALPSDGTARDRVLFDPTGLADRPLDVTLERAGERVAVHIGAGGEVKVGG